MIRLAAGLCLAAGGAAATGLDDRAVSFGGLAYEIEAAPVFAGRRWPAKVGPGWEYGLDREGSQNGWDLVPVAIDIASDRITVAYPADETGIFPDLAFNGYVLDFLTDCVLFEGAAPDPANSTVTLAEGDVFTRGSALYIDMGGQPYGPDTILSILVKVADCPLS